MRLIDAENAIRRLRAAEEKDEAKQKFLEMLVKYIDTEPTVEKAVLPVWCGECRDFLGGYCPGFQPDGYCSEGRKPKEAKR